MALMKHLEKFFTQFRSGTRSLKTVLAIYFIPISILPTIFISFYATRVFEENTRDTLVRRATSERNAFVAEIDALETDLLAQARSHAASAKLQAAVRSGNRPALEELLQGLRQNVSIRVYSPDGAPLGVRPAPGEEPRIAYIAKEGLKRVKMRGETLERFVVSDLPGFLILTRVLIRDRDRLYAVLEEEYQFGTKDLQELKSRRQVDVVLMNRDFLGAAGSFALNSTEMKRLGEELIQPSFSATKEPYFQRIGDDRFATFLFDLPGPFGRTKKWGYVGVFLSMSSIDVTVGKLKLAMVYLTLLLTLIATLLIFIFSNRLVKPIEMLVSAMKRVKTGRVEQIPAIESAYEVEYLVHSFNEMSRNVSAAKRTLEIKLEELHKANQEIKDTQSTLVQSAKMISLGQIVAGVAHELNNPIAFIYSNMHHLSDYVAKIKQLVELYRTLQAHLPPDDKARAENLERRLELDYILKDMEELTQSCLEGANRTKEIVMGLRTFSRMEESSFRPSDLQEGMRNTLRLLFSEFRDRIHVHEEFGEIPLVECNQSQINQVFMNLLSNAAQAITGRGDIWIRTRLDGDSVVVEVEDNGGGIPAELVEKIFDPFFTTKKVGEGTGLGLSIAYGLIQKHNGTIQVSSQVGRGTLFRIRLPIRQTALAVG